MNAGGEASHGDHLLFLHADTRLPAHAVALVAKALAGKRCWGRFDVRLTGRPPLLSMIAAAMSLRSRLTGIATGDQAMFMTREAFEAVGGFPVQPLMEDIEMSRRLKRLSGLPAREGDELGTTLGAQRRLADDPPHVATSLSILAWGQCRHPGKGVSPCALTPVMSCH